MCSRSRRLSAPGISPTSSRGYRRGNPPTATPARAAIADISQLEPTTYEQQIATRPIARAVREGTEAEPPSSKLWQGAAFVGLLVLGIVLGYGLFSRSDEQIADLPPPPRPVPSALLKSHEPAPPVAEPDLGVVNECFHEPGMHLLGTPGDPLAPRAHQVYIPEGLEPQSPLMVLFHEDYQTPEQIIEFTDLKSLADRERFAIFAPRGSNMAWRTPEFAERASLSLEDVVAQLCSDKSRIVGVGHGPGGHGVTDMQCNHGPFAAIATSAYRRENANPPCEKPVPTLLFNALSDGYSRVEGWTDETRGCGLFPKISLKQHEDEIAEANGCGAERSSSFTYRSSECWTLKCRDAAFETCHIDGGRGWTKFPQRAIDVRGCDGPNTDFPNAERIWAFFQRTALGDD